MHDEQKTQVAERPDRPLLVFDGDCGFCRQWVARWRGITGERVDYRPSREVAGRFPEIGDDRFRARVWLIEPNGHATGGARAVLRLYALIGEKRVLNLAYEEVPPLAIAAEWVYDLVARNREAAAVATRWLWGASLERPRYCRMRVLLLRALGAVYLAAFVSFAVQVDGLIGSRGVVPAHEFLDELGPILGTGRYWQLPTLFWLGCSDGTLHLVCWGGAVIGGLLVAGVLPRVCLLLLWLGYLSLLVVGQPFLGYQWDVLLLESGFLAILFAPWGFWLGRARAEPSRAMVWLIRWLVFRLMFLSGVVKLTSGDPTWRAWEAMRFHYETQPLPSWTSWWMHQLPPWVHTASVGFMFWAELIAPILVFGPRRVRMLGFWSLVLLQVLIAATGNYGFFNVLSVVLCLSLVEDADWNRVWRRRDVAGPEPVRAATWRRGLLGFAGMIIVAVTTMEGIDRSGWTVVFPGPLEALRGGLAPLHSMNSYGLFAVMTTDRPEIIVEGSRDGTAWLPYEFRWKPGDVRRRPRFTTPHMPRLDWQMWFAALGGDCRRERWFLGFERRLLEGSPAVLGLLRDDPFAGQPPRYLRARLDRYRFTGRGDPAWWQRHEIGPYCPPLGLSRADPASARPDWVESPRPVGGIPPSARADRGEFAAKRGRMAVGTVHASGQQPVMGTAEPRSTPLRTIPIPMEGVSMTRSGRTMVTSTVASIAVLGLAAGLAGMVNLTARADDSKVPVTFAGGHEIGRNDYGRPVALIAAALEVKPDVFRKAFSGVTPSRNGPPSKEQARRNKSALMKVLAPHGVTNDRLDEVSNYYRFRRDRGELWPTTPAEAYATVENGKVTKIVVTKPGSGYCTPPQATVRGMVGAHLNVTLSLGTDLKTNGAIKSIDIVPADAPKNER